MVLTIPEIKPAIAIFCLVFKKNQILLNFQPQKNLPCDTGDMCYGTTKACAFRYERQDPLNGVKDTAIISHWFFGG